MLEDIPGKPIRVPDPRKPRRFLAVGESPHHQAVRVVFRKSGEEWIPFKSDCSAEELRGETFSECRKEAAKSFPPQASWTLAFDGRKFGELQTRVSDYFFLGSDGLGLENIVGSSEAPYVAKTPQDDVDWNWRGGSVRRSIVAVSRPNFSDPDRWKPAPLTPRTIESLRAAFRKRNPKVENCADPNENIARPWDYSDVDIRIKKAYSSRRGWSLAHVLLQEDKCDGIREGPFAGQWFVVDPKGGVEYLDQEMELVDAGDYDGDGRSEVVFVIEGAHAGGYKIFSADFKKRAVFEFGLDGT